MCVSYVEGWLFTLPGGLVLMWRLREDLRCMMQLNLVQHDHILVHDGGKNCTRRPPSTFCHLLHLAG